MELIFHSTSLSLSLSLSLSHTHAHNLSLSLSISQSLQGALYQTGGWEKLVGTRVFRSKLGRLVELKLILAPCMNTLP